MRRVILSATVLFGVVLVIFAVLHWSKRTTVDQVRQIIDESYYLADVEVSGGTAENVVDSLPDRYSHIRDSAHSADVDLENKTYFGFEISLDRTDDNYKISQVFPGSSADKNGLRPGMSVTSINGASTEEMSQERLDQIMQQASGRPLSLRVDGHRKTLTPGLFANSTVIYRQLDLNMGYLKIYGFLDTTEAELKRVIRTIDQSQTTHLVIDLRGNSGGVSGSSLVLANALVPVGRLVSFQDQAGYKDVIKADGRGVLTDIQQIVIFVNQYTASEAEVLTTALQDNGRGVTVGTRTYGKGLSLTLFPLNNGQVLQLATHQWLRPTGENIEGEGITPKVLVEDIKDWSKIPWKEVW